jgi:predicted ester cyclase
VDLKWVMNMVRISGGQIIEEWEIFDQMDFAKQMGMID